MSATSSLYKSMTKIAKTLITHTYSNLPSLDRLLLLIAAIAQNPGIASQNEAYAKKVDSMELLISAMIQIADQQGIEFNRPSPYTLRADLRTLREYGILPSGTALRSGYYLGNPASYFPKEAPPKRLSRNAERDLWIKELRSEGATLKVIAQQVNLSQQRVSQILGGGD